MIGAESRAKSKFASISKMQFPDCMVYNRTLRGVLASKHSPQQPEHRYIGQIPTLRLISHRFLISSASQMIRERRLIC